MLVLLHGQINIGVLLCVPEVIVENVAVREEESQMEVAEAF